MIADQPTGALADPLLQFDPSGNLQFRYFSGPTPAGDDTVYTEEQIGTQGQAGTETWPLGDNENTPHEVVNVNSTVVDHIIANTFGVVTSESDPSVHHWSGFEGGHLDVDTAMIDDYFRWYDPPTAKWLSEDPKGFSAGDDDLTRYVGNSATDIIDPSGLKPPWHLPGADPWGDMDPDDVIAALKHKSKNIQTRAVPAAQRTALKARSVADRAATVHRERSIVRERRRIDVEIENVDYGAEVAMRRRVLQIRRVEIGIRVTLPVKNLQSASEMINDIERNATIGPVGIRPF